MTTEKETQEKVGQLQLLQQNLQGLAMQKQQFQVQLNEIEAAEKEVKNAKKAYKIVGNIMVLSNEEDLKKDFKEKKEMIELRLKNIETQEERLRKKSEDLQKDVMKELKKDKKNG